jgi:hypothetical protein
LWLDSSCPVGFRRVRGKSARQKFENSSPCVPGTERPQGVGTPCRRTVIGQALERRDGGVNPPQWHGAPRHWETPKKAVTMTTGKTTNIKSLLRDECLPALNQSAAYFSMADVLAWLYYTRFSLLLAFWRTVGNSKLATRREPPRARDGPRR